MPITETPVSEWKWYGTYGHCIIGRWCRFHLLTVVGDYLVSTIGEYVHPSHSGGGERNEAEWLKDHWPGEEVGCGRKYETMVFHAGEPCTAEGCECGEIGFGSGDELEMLGYNTRKDATAGHMELCLKWSRCGPDGKEA
jgi:hypothetical protein